MISIVITHSRYDVLHTMLLRNTKKCTHILVISVLTCFLLEREKPIEEIVPKMFAQTMEEKPQKGERIFGKKKCCYEN